MSLAELFAGIQTAADERRLVAALVDFRTIPIPDTLWEQAGRHQAALRSAGVTVPLLDSILASLAMDLDVELWTYDRHFALIQSVVPIADRF